RVSRRASMNASMVARYAPQEKECSHCCWTQISSQVLRNPLNSPDKSASSPMRCKSRTQPFTNRDLSASPNARAIQSADRCRAFTMVCASLRCASVLNIQRWQTVYDLLGFQADCDHSLEQLQRVLGVAHGFDGPIVGVVDDTAGFVGFDALALHHPVQRR